MKKGSNLSFFKGTFWTPRTPRGQNQRLKEKADFQPPTPYIPRSHQKATKERSGAQ